jgi:flagellar hook assembly protein FlgD
LAQQEQAEVNIYDVRGRLVRKLLRAHVGAGMHTVKWDGTNSLGQRVTSGIYFYQLKAGSYNMVRKMQLVK